MFKSWFSRIWYTLRLLRSRSEKQKIFWDIFIYLSFALSQTYRKNAKKRNEISQNGLPSPRGPSGGIPIFFLNKGSTRTYQIPFKASKNKSWSCRKKTCFFGFLVSQNVKRIWFQEIFFSRFLDKFIIKNVYNKLLYNKQYLVTLNIASHILTVHSLYKTCKNIYKYYRHYFLLFEIILFIVN